MSTGLRFEAITPSHAPVLAALHATGFGRSWPEEAFVRLLSNDARSGVLAVADGMPCGFLMLQRAAEEAEILTLVVAPERRRQGIGKALLDWTIGWAAQGGLSRLILDVNERNDAARRLYVNRGFAEIGQRSGYYLHSAGAETALVLALDVAALVVPGRATR